MVKRKSVSLLFCHTRYLFMAISELVSDEVFGKQGGGGGDEDDDDFTVHTSEIL